MVPAARAARAVSVLHLLAPLATLATLAAVSACGGARPHLAAPPPAESATALSFPVEHIRRGDAPVPVAADTERNEGRIRAAVLRQRSTVQQCYERILPASPEASGNITFTFTVETQGLVHDATAEADSPVLRPTRDCLLAVIRAARVEGLDHAVLVTWPFAFENPSLAFTVPEIVLTPRSRPVAPDSVAAAVGAGSGDLTPTEVREVTDTRQADILGCYTTLLRTARRAEGSARFELTVAPDGSPASVTLASVDDPVQPAADCIAQVLQTLRFRNTGRRAQATVPVTLRLRDTPPGPR